MHFSKDIGIELCPEVALKHQSSSSPLKVLKIINDAGWGIIYLGCIQCNIGSFDLNMFMHSLNQNEE